MKACRISSSRAGVVARGGTLIAEGLDVIRTTGAGLRLESLEDGSRVRAFRISETGDAGISIEKGKVALEHGLLLGCESGLSISGGARVSAAQLTIAATPTAVEVDVPAVVPGDGGARTVVVPQGGRVRPVPVARPRVTRVPSSGRSVLDLTRSVIAPADVPLVAGDGAQVTLSHSVVAPGSAEAPKGDGVLSAIPRFAAPGRGDFRLDKGSAGAGRGPGGADWGKVE
jgi:hypothetical protein